MRLHRQRGADDEDERHRDDPAESEEQLLEALGDEERGEREGRIGRRAGAPRVGQA